MSTHLESMRNHWWWRPGWREGRRFYTWHLTFDGQDDVHRLAADYRAALAPLGPDDFTLIPDQWLHLTMQGVGFVDETDTETVDAIVAAAHQRLAHVPAFLLQLGPGTVVDPEAILLPAQPAEPVHAVRNAIRAAIGDVLSDVPEKETGFRPHVSVAYSAGDGPMAPVARTIAASPVTPALAPISSAELIVLGRDRQMYEWESYATVRLG
ncbi:2'-5' RNA ligase family protein [Streptomyces sp. NPDC094437]|uniref:2'-5' RNA ligase family protein n=1 Tax=Streptomyces sp. NPDC094437 TaxID=3366060 RepID=UPI0037FF616E